MSDHGGHGGHEAHGGHGGHEEHGGHGGGHGHGGSEGGIFEPFKELNPLNILDSMTDELIKPATADLAFKVIEDLGNKFPPGLEGGGHGGHGGGHGGHGGHH